MSGLLLLTVAVLILGRLLGPGVAVVRDATLSPILENGDIVWVRPVRGNVDRGTVVLVVPHFSRSTGLLPNPFTFNGNSSTENEIEDDQPANPEETSPAPARSDAVVPRIVAGLSGDDMTWTDSLVSSIASDGTRFQLSLEVLHPLLRPVERTATVPENSVFTVSLTAGMIDSRLIGPRPNQKVRYQVRRIIWPRERRGVLLPVESRRNVSP